MYCLVIIAEDECACGMPRWLLASALAYKEVHGPLAVAVCVLGSVANCLNLVVLRDLRSAPVNRILSYLAMVDVLVMLLYLPFAYEVYIDPERQWRSYLPGWAAFLLLHMQLAQVGHSFHHLCLFHQIKSKREISLGA